MQTAAFLFKNGQRVHRFLMLRIKSPGLNPGLSIFNPVGVIPQFNPTLINVNKQTANTNEIRQYIEPAIVEYVRTNADLAILRENRAAICFFYRDKSVNYLFSITVKPEQYE